MVAVGDNGLSLSFFVNRVTTERLCFSDGWGVDAQPLPERGFTSYFRRFPSHGNYAIGTETMPGRCEPMLEAYVSVAPGRLPMLACNCRVAEFEDFVVADLTEMVGDIHGADNHRIR